MIVFNAQQTQDLIDKGRTPNYARSLATGTIYNGINAYAGTAGNNNFFKPGTPGANTSTNANTTATNNNTKATNANTKAAEEAKTGLDKFKEWGEKLFDWVEVRLERLRQSIDRNTAKSENQISTTKQNEYLQKAMEVIGNPTNPSKSKGNTLIGDNLAGAKRYQQQADKVRQQAIANGLVNTTEADQIIERIKNGAIDISEYEEGPREFINSYKEW